MVESTALTELQVRDLPGQRRRAEATGTAPGYGLSSWLELAVLTWQALSSRDPGFCLFFETLSSVSPQSLVPATLPQAGFSCFRLQEIKGLLHCLFLQTGSLGPCCPDTWHSTAGHLCQVCCAPNADPSWTLCHPDCLPHFSKTDNSLDLRCEADFAGFPSLN